ncbi:MAG: gamma-glutamyl kinase [Pseudomonadota bacterium]
MLVFWKEKIVLLAVPKTGTTALERALAPRASTAILAPPGLKHTSARRYRREVAPWLTRDGAWPHETVAVIREPLDWLGSWYRYRRRSQIDGSDTSTADIDFESFVAAWLQPKPPAFARIGSQARFLTGGRGRLLVQHLFRYEEFDHLLSFLADRLGAPVRVPQANVSPKEGLTLSNDLEAHLRKAAARDFELWESAGR